MLEMTRDEIAALLDQTLIGRLAMADESGKPYAIPLPFSWVNDSIYLRLPLKGRKGQILNQNDQVCFEVDVFSDCLDDYASVLIEGTLVEVTDLQEKGQAKHVSDEKYNRLRRGYRPGHGRGTPLQELPLRKIAVTRLSGRRRGPSPAVAASIPVAL